MNQVQELIINALNIADQKELRDQAEETIYSLLRSNPSEFFIACSQIISDNNKKDTIRQSTAVVMKALIAKKDQKNVFYWDWIPSQQKTIIKEALINNLISPNVLVMRAGANAIAQIAAIEIPRNEWLQIVNNLASNAIHEDYNIRRASITTLGFICQELRGIKSNINQLSCQQILGSIIIGLHQQGGDIVQISIDALRNSISFLTTILDSQEYCEKLFEYLLPIFLTDLKRKVYEVLYEFGKYSYHHFFNIDPSYLNKVVQFSLEHIQSRSQISISALQFWDTLGCEFMRRMQDSKNRINSENNNNNNILQQFHHVILPEVMACIIIVTKEDLEFPELREIAVKTLGTFVECCNRQIVDKITEGVSRVISSPKAGERQASVLLFSCLSHFSDHEYVMTCFRNGFVHLYQLINDSQMIVKKNTLNGFLTLSQIFPEVFLENTDLLGMFDHLLGLSSFNDEDIYLLSLTILSNITDCLKDFPNCKIVQQPSEFLQKLIPIFSNNLQTSNQSRNEKIMVIILNVAITTIKKDVIIQLTTYLIEQYDLYAKSRIQDREIVLEQILTIIHTCILSLSKFATPSNLRDKIFQVIDRHIKSHGVSQEGINMISGAAICFKKDFLTKIDKYWNIILSGIQSKDQKPLFKASLSCISDISRGFQSAVASKLIPVFQRLLSYMHQITDRQLKCQILKCFGDLCLGLKDYGQNYVQKLIMISETCFTAVYQLSQIESQKEYAEQLKESLIEMYHCVVFAQNEQNKANLRLADHFPLISTFIVQTCDVRHKPTVDYLRQCLYLIFDSALFYSKHRDYKLTIDNIINSNQIKNLLGLIQKYRDKPQIYQLLNFIQDKMKMYRR